MDPDHITISSGDNAQNEILPSNDVHFKIIEPGLAECTSTT